ncbi:YbxH family protein [Cytobacillus firmus]|uniref:YbxH family protein n=1 Tax=Cytobacillus firmus TaxID=1399 RepID=UPI00222846C6|nr:YbxH family protein [Cytobacillus firmus]
MGAIERNGYRFEPEFSVISQNGAIHVFHNGKFVEELTFEFSGKFPENDQIEKMVAQYCNRRGL